VRFLLTTVVLSRGNTIEPTLQ